MRALRCLRLAATLAACTAPRPLPELLPLPPLPSVLAPTPTAAPTPVPPAPAAPASDVPPGTPLPVAAPDSSSSVALGEEDLAALIAYLEAL
jgi:hypothetical protein